MDISNKYTYLNKIYSAIVVNQDYNQDPLQQGRVQIYIPSVHFEYADVYRDYMENTDKLNSEYWDVFPWATCLVAEIKNGDNVVGGYLDNQGDNYVVIGKNVNNPTDSVRNGTTLGVTGSGILNLTMPILLFNEVSLPLNCWADNIPDDKYQKITPSDKGAGWSIGLIQWHHTRAFDCLYEIAKVDGNWEDNFSDKNLQLVEDLRASVKSGSDSGYRIKYQADFKPTEGTAQYNGIKNMLGSTIGKETQRKYASVNTAANIDTMMNEYNIQNPAILIFMADVMNQYGPNLPTTLRRASTISSSDSDMLTQLDELITYMKGNWSNYNEYVTRRDNTYSYIKDLYNNGKLREVTDLVDLKADNINNVNGAGAYCMPFEGKARLTATWGYGGYRFTNLINRGYHTGLDFGCKKGTKLYACTSGTISINSQSQTSGYGYSLKIMGDDGKMIIYGHCNSFVKTSGRVTKGELIAYSGNTGNSSGPHLHFEIRHSPYRWSNKGSGDDENPLPYIGASDKERNDYVGG